VSPVVASKHPASSHETGPGAAFEFILDPTLLERNGSEVTDKDNSTTETPSGQAIQPKNPKELDTPATCAFFCPENGTEAVEENRLPKAPSTVEKCEIAADVKIIDEVSATDIGKTGAKISATKSNIGLSEMVEE